MSTKIQQAAERRFDAALQALTAGKVSVGFVGNGSSNGAYRWTVSHEETGDRDVSYTPVSRTWECSCDDFANYGEALGHCPHTIAVWLGHNLQDDAQANGTTVGDLLADDAELAESMKVHFIEATLEARGDGEATEAGETEADDAAPDTSLPSNDSASANSHGPTTAPTSNGETPAAAGPDSNGAMADASATAAPASIHLVPNGNGHGLQNPAELIFTDEVIEELEKPLDPSRVKTRRGPGGRQLSYIEGQDAIQTANRIFGHGNWGYELLEIWRDGLLMQARVRVQVRGALPITEIGTCIIAAGRGQEPSHESVETATKGAVTDGVKRGLKNYGDQFGLGLYFPKRNRRRRSA